MRRHYKKLLVLLGFLAIIWAAVEYFSPITFEQESLYIQSGTRLWPITVEIAKTTAQQSQGLMYRHTLGQNKGMLFINSHPKPMRMWMKNTRIPLDMLFINERGIIVHIAPNTLPGSTQIITYDQPVKAVLELPGGTTKKRFMKVGDTVVHEAFVLYGPPR